MLGGIYRIIFVILLILLPGGVGAALVNINIADSLELQTLNGIGPSYAQRIIDYRTANGLFQTIEDVKLVKGIGDATFNKIKDYITVGDAVSDTDPETATTTESIASPAQTSPPEEDAYSAHYSAAPLSDTKSKLNITAGAGRERLGSIGTPLEFKADTNLEYTRNTSFKWNFGDGSLGEGEQINHAYKYPGEYIAVLNVTSPEGKAVARTNIKIIEPQLHLVSASEDKIEIKNNSQYEVSLFGRALLFHGMAFIFPQDTIVKSRQTIAFSSSITGLHPSAISDVAMLVVGKVEQSQLLKKIEEERLKEITNIENQLSALEKQLALNSANNENNPVAINRAEIISSYAASSEAATGTPSTPETAIAIEGFKGWFKTLRHFFLRTK